MGPLPPVLPPSSGTPRALSIWLIPIILAIIAAVGLVYFIFFILIWRRRYYPTKHQRRQAELAGAIAREMNLSKKMVNMLRVFGIHHGTGSVEWPYPVARTALQYHERLNGAGYPQKLADDDLLLEARILAVADTIETTSSPRPHRPEISLVKALEEIKLNSSALYNSQVEQALVRLVEQGKFKFQTLYN